MAAKHVTIRLWLNTYQVEGECETCGFDALIRAVSYYVTTAGVRTMVEKTACGRCIAERNRDE